MLKTFFFINLILFFFSATARSEEWVSVAMHVASTVSDGTLTVDEILKAGQDEEVDALILTDRDFMKWEYGLWPLRKLIRKTVEANSVFRYGFSKYLEMLDFESKKNHGILLIPGLESAPYHYWKRRPFSKDFAICDWHKHLLVALPDSRDLEALPVYLNPKGRAVGRFSVFLVWPFLTLVFGIFVLWRPGCSYRDIKGRELGRPSKRCRIIGAGMVLVSLIFFANNFPFRRDTVDPYHPGDKKEPYQRLIDYVEEKDGVIFWAHPEARYITRQGPVEIHTEEAVADLWRTTGYTGYSIFHEGYARVGKLGGAWDALLKQYCRDERARPVWATAGLAFDYGTAQDLRRAMRELRLNVLSDSLTKQGVLEAMRRGRMVVTRGADAARYRLAEFFVIDDPSGRVATLGEELVFDGTPLLCVKGGGPAGGAQAKVLIIRDGAVFQELTVPSDFDIVVEDKAPLPGKTYYRLEIKQGGSLTVTNPIFVRPSMKKQSMGGDYRD